MQLDKIVETIKTENKKVILYGASHLSELAIGGMLIKGIYPAVAYDRELGITQKRIIHGIPIMPPSLLFSEPKDAFIFLTIDYESPFIKKELNNAGFFNVFDSLEFMELIDIDQFATDIERLEVNGYGGPVKKSIEDFELHEPHYYYKRILLTYRNIIKQINTGVLNHLKSIIIVPGTKCNFRCVDCCADVQYFDKNHEYSVPIIKASLDRIFTTIKSIDTVVLSGCEPFMHKNMMDIVRLVRSYKQVQRITISTNASVVPSKDIFIELDQLGVEVRFSNYGSIVRNWHLFFEEANKYMRVENRTSTADVLYERGIRIERLTSWMDQGGYTKREFPEESLSKEAMTCPSRRMLLLYEDKLYHCWRSASCMRLGILPEMQGEYLHILDDTLTDKAFSERLTQMVDFVGKMKPLRACDYCNGRRIIDRPMAEQIDHKMDPFEKDDTAIIEQEKKKYSIAK